MENTYKKYDHEIDSFVDSFKKDVKELGIKKSELNSFLNLKRASESLLGDKSKVIIKEAWANKNIVKKLKTENDFYFFVTSMIISKNPMKKVAYPMSENYFFKNPFFGYNLQSWASCVHKIYDSVYSEGIEYSDAVKKYSSNIFKDEEERTNFLNWLKYYNHGEHLKYSAETPKISKKAVYQMPLSATGDAYTSGSNYIGQDYVLDHDLQSNDAREKGESKINYKNWKKKFNTALRRVDKILKESEDYVDADKYEEISQVLNKLDVQVGKIRLQASASDMSYRAATQLKKLGFGGGASVLFKYSQDASPPSLDAEVPPAVAEQASSQIAQSAESGEPSAEEQARKQVDREATEKGRQVMKDISPLPGPNPDEYKEILSGDVSIDDASKKLEQIAGTLADRRVIRYLAEFDIMLDKVGIASMFPELAEAQSKLIESYSYALTRVTKMLGMLSNNRVIMELSNQKDEAENVPGVAKPDQVEEAVAPIVETPVQQPNMNQPPRV